MKKLNSKGFTLIELVVVIVILGILALLVIPKISAYTNQAKTSTCVANMRSYKSAMVMWQAQDLNNHTLGAASLTTGTLNSFMEKPAICPGGGTYSLDKTHLPDFVDVLCTGGGHRGKLANGTDIGDPLSLDAYLGD